MKAIVVPTDFSETAQNALNYAKLIASKSGATIHLCHFYSLALNTLNSPESMIPDSVFDEVRDIAKSNLEQIAVQLRAEGFECKTYVNAGDLTSEILDLTKKIDADLTVMGTTGASNVINKLIGSNALSVMQNSENPIILVPQQYKQTNQLKDIVFADDFEQDNSSIIYSLTYFIETMQIDKIDLLRVNIDTDLYDDENETISKTLSELFGEKKVNFNLVYANNFEEGFEKYKQTHAVDLLVMSTKKKNLLQRIFSHSNTKAMAMHVDVPLMVYRI